MKALLAVMTGPTAKHERRRQLLRETWFSELHRFPNMELQVVYGDDLRHSLEPHEVILDCIDSYQNLPLKTLAYLRFAIHDPTWDYIFKCDDDTYVHLDRLYSYLLSLDHHNASGFVYAGCLAFPGTAWEHEPPYASGGAGYFLSRKLVWEMIRKFATALEADYPEGAEDLIVGRCAKMSGVKLIENTCFIPYGNSINRPLPSNGIITTHKIHEDLFRDTFRQNHP